MITNQVDHATDFSQGTSIVFMAVSPNSAAKTRIAKEYTNAALIERIVHEIGQPLRTVARRVRRFGPKDGGTIVMLAGCKHAMGCTTAALALGVAASEDGPTVVIDGDDANRGLSQGLGTPATTGWCDVVHGSVRLPAALHGMGSWSGTMVLPMPLGQARTNNLIGSPRFARLLADLRREFHLIVVDAGAVKAEGYSWAPWVDIALLVCDAGENLNAEWATAWDLLEEKGAHVMGVIETNA